MFYFFSLFEYFEHHWIHSLTSIRIDLIIFLIRIHFLNAQDVTQIYIMLREIVRLPSEYC